LGEEHNNILHQNTFLQTTDYKANTLKKKNKFNIYSYLFYFLFLSGKKESTAFFLPLSQ